MKNLTIFLLLLTSSCVVRETYRPCCYPPVYEPEKEKTPVMMAVHQETEEEKRERILYEIMAEMKYRSKMQDVALRRLVREAKLHNAELLVEQKTIKSQIQELKRVSDQIKVREICPHIDSSGIKSPSIQIIK